VTFDMYRNFTADLLGAYKVEEITLKVWVKWKP
jgi:hypothetical protein